MIAMDYPALFLASWKIIWKSIYLWLFAAITATGSIFAFLMLPGLFSIISLFVQYLCTLVGSACLIRAVYEIEQNKRLNFIGLLVNIKPLLGRLFLIQLITFSLALILVAPLSYLLFQVFTEAPDIIHLSLWFIVSVSLVFSVYGILSFFPAPNVIIRESSVGYALRHGLRELIGSFKPVVVISLFSLMISLLFIVVTALIVFYSAGGLTQDINSIALYLSYRDFTRTSIGSLFLIGLAFLLTPYMHSLSTITYLEITK
jgi:hypothetical protein